MVGGGHLHAHEGGGAPGLLARGAQALEEAIAGGFPAHPAQGPEQTGQLFAADGNFLLPPAVALGDDVEFFVLAEEFHFDRALNLLPGEILPLGAGGFDARPRGAHEVAHGRRAGAQFGQLLFGGDAAVHGRWDSPTGHQRSAQRRKQLKPATPAAIHDGR